MSNTITRYELEIYIDNKNIIFGIRIWGEGWDEKIFKIPNAYVTRNLCLNRVKMEKEKKKMLRQQLYVDLANFYGFEKFVVIK